MSTYVTIFILGLLYDALMQYKRSKFTHFFKFVIHMFDCNLTFFLFETYLYSIA